MSTPAAASPTGSRPSNGLLLATFGALSAFGLFMMRILSVIKDAPVGFQDILAADTFPNGVLRRKHFTGVGPIDEVLAMLATAFMSGAAGWNEAFYWQQFHFLMQIAPMIAVMTVEACRARNQGSWLKYTTVWAFLYQNIGGAVLIPLWMLLLHNLSGSNQYFTTGREVPIQYARLLLPSIVLLYFVPTIAVYIPGWSTDTLQVLLAIWQPTPFLVNVPLWLASPFVSYSKPATTKNADLPHLKILYNVLFVASFLSHAFTIFNVAASETPGVSLAQVFVPSPAHWLTSTDQGMMWIFQWDWIVCALVHIIPSMVAVYDVVRFIPETDTDPLGDRLFKGFYISVALTVFGGPGAALAAIWGWREEQLVVIEERAKSGKKTL